MKSAYLSLTSILGAGETLSTDGENGFLSMAFHPDFASNGFLFVYYTVRVGYRGQGGVRVGQGEP